MPATQSDATVAQSSEYEEQLRLRESRRRRQQRITHWSVRAGVFVIFLGLWQLIGSNINPLYLSTPDDVVRALWDMAQNGELGKAVLSSCKVIAIGLGISVVVGIVFGVLMGRIRLLEVVFEPYVNALYVAPRIALVPLILIWFGIGEEAQIVVVLLSSVFPILINAYTGARTVNQSWLETGRSFGASRWQEFVQITLPGSVPFIATGLRLGVGQAVIGMVVAQMFLALDGLGELLVNYSNNFDTPHVLAVVIVISALGIVLTALVKALERRFAHWKAVEK